MKTDSGAGGDAGSSLGDRREAKKAKKSSATWRKVWPLPVLRSTPGKGHRVVTFFVLTWMAWQAFMPYSHFVTKGYNGWTEGLYGYSWDMMIKTWSTQHVRVSYKDSTTGEVGYLNPEMFCEGSGGRWSSHPDMIKQFAQCVQRKFAEYNVTDFKLYVDVWRSMTKRFQQRMFDPRADLITADWSAFSTPPWVMPLLSELSDWRGRLDQIKREKEALVDADGDGDGGFLPNIVFAADFPGLYLENYVNKALDNTTIELLQGEIEIEFLGLDGDEFGEEEEQQKGGGGGGGGGGGERAPPKPHVLSQLAIDKRNITLNVPGQSIWIPNGEYHRIHTIGSKPSCYMFVYENTTDKAEYKKETAIRKMFETMVNASKDEPEKLRNFSDPSVVAEFFGDKQLDEKTIKLDEKTINRFAENFKNVTEKEEKEKSQVFGQNMAMKILNKMKEKLYKVYSKYSKALWLAHQSFKSIREGRSLETLLDELSKAEKKKREAEAAEAKMEAEAKSEAEAKMEAEAKTTETTSHAEDDVIKIDDAKKDVDDDLPRTDDAHGADGAHGAHGADGAHGAHGPLDA